MTLNKKWLWIALGIIVLIVAIVVIQGVLRARSMGFLRSPVFETVPPEVPAMERPAVLLFSKTNSFIHKEAIPAARALLGAMGVERNWSVFLSDNGAIHNREDLAKFDVIVWNNVTGDVLTTEQRSAMRTWLEQGGGFVGLHGAGDNSHEAWPWYQQTIIRANFIGHPLDPQFQEATVRLESPIDPSVAGLPTEWRRTDEWYSFDKSPRAPDVTVVATLDESTYDPGEFFGEELGMGGDHPIIWKHCIGEGRVYYSAMGHTAESYEEPEYQDVLRRAIEWAGRLDDSTAKSASDLACD